MFYPDSKFKVFIVLEFKMYYQVFSVMLELLKALLPIEVERFKSMQMTQSWCYKQFCGAAK